MTLTPSLQLRTARFRGPSSSADFNATNREVHADIITAYSALNVQIAATELANETLAITNAALQKQVGVLQQRLSSLQSSFQSLAQINTPGDQAVMGVSLYDVDVSYGGVPSYPPLSAASRAAYDPVYGQILPNIATPAVSKCYLSDPLTGAVVLPPGVAASAPSQITPTVAPFLIEENDPGNAVDGTNTNLWRRNVYFPLSQRISEVTTTLTVTLPQQFINALTCNYVSVHPYPVMGVDIVSVVLKGLPGSQDTQLLPVDLQGNPQPIAGAGPVRIVFPDQAVTAVELTLRASQPILTLKPGLQAFVLGAQTVDVGWMGFNMSPSKILVPFRLANNFFSAITGVSTLPAGVSAALYARSASGDYVKLAVGATPLGYCRDVYVELTMSPQDGIVPVLSSLALTFLPMYVLN